MNKIQKPLHALFPNRLEWVLFALITAALNGTPVTLSGACPLFAPAVLHPVGSGPTDFAQGDLNSDGNLDLAVPNWGSGDIALLFGDGQGDFAAPYWIDYGTAHPNSLRTADFNLDGLTDFVVANGYPDNSLSIVLADEYGSYETVIYPTDDWPACVTVGDFNEDGSPDIAWVRTYSEAVLVMLGNGDGLFQSPTSYQVQAVPSALAVGDFNGDGKQDLASANQLANSVSVLLGIGDGTFQNAVNYPAGQFPHGVVAGDFNEDGQQDLAVADVWTGLVSVLLGNGDGTFQPLVPYAAGPNAFSVTAADFNSDGHTDLAVPDLNSQVSILLGNGDGTFQAADTYSAGQSPTYAVVGDFNDDGRQDLAVTSDDGVSILLGNICNTAPVITQISGPTTPVRLGDSVTLQVIYTDPDLYDTQTVTFVWGDGQTNSVVGNEGSASGMHTYPRAGVYTVNITVTDAAGASASTNYGSVVVYDPSSFVTGGGWIDSPTNALTANPALTGKANFGLIASYHHRGTIPAGQIEFQFPKAGLNFHSTCIDWLVIVDNNTQCRGSGTCNGAGEFGFLLTASDDGSLDAFGIKIWNKTTDAVVYDNAVTLAQPIGAGNIVIHK